jgi:hypothetical protein
MRFTPGAIAFIDLTITGESTVAEETPVPERLDIGARKDACFAAERGDRDLVHSFELTDVTDCAANARVDPKQESRIMKTSTLFFLATLALAANAVADGTAAQANQSATSSTAVTADRSGASAASGNASAASASTKHAQADAAGRSEMTATLSKPVDARKAKPGDGVTATNDKDAKTADGTSIKQGSKLVGHVAKAQPLDKSASGSARGNGESMLSIVFDKAILKDGREVPLNATIQAVSAAESNASLASDMGAGGSAFGTGTGTTHAAGGGLLGGAGGSVAGGLGAAGGLAGGAGHGVNGAVGGMADAAVQSAGAVGGLTSSGALTSGSKGVFGIKGMDITSSTTGGAEGSVITSTTRNVRLDGGTKMLLSSSAGGGSATASTASQAASTVSKSGSAEHSAEATAAPVQKSREPADRR